ncbi:MAG: DUF4124 domain-containing protein [Burkholderiales bacterium]|nr:MAG: DUF4124 domain-containing protein [Burkholderiales bacterium]TAG79335.1 MAG: DUF4124 domain-containing protein [Betaproteobacteria bacterium]
MRRILGLSATLVLCAQSNWASAQIYKYVDPATGAVEYTNQPRKGAQRMNLDGSLSEIPTGNTTRRNTQGQTSGSTQPRAVAMNSLVNNNPGTAVDSETQRTRDGTRQRILSDELASEEKALAEARAALNNGKPLPMADETPGSAKYIDRVKQIERTLRHHERNVAALKQEIANLRM